MPVVGTRANASVRGYGWSSLVGESLDGMVLMKPTSVVSTGSSNLSIIEANGSVTFLSCATLSLNGVFTADYDHYLIVSRLTSEAVTSANLRYRMRASGSDNATTSSYTIQEFRVSGTAETAVRATGTFGELTHASISNQNGMTAYIFGPYLSVPTVIRTTGRNSFPMDDFATSHNQSNSYDGITIYPSSSSITGTISVYGLED